MSTNEYQPKQVKVPSYIVSVPESALQRKDRSLLGTSLEYVATASVGGLVLFALYGYATSPGREEVPLQQQLASFSSGEISPQEEYAFLQNLHHTYHQNIYLGFRRDGQCPTREFLQHFVNAGRYAGKMDLDERMKQQKILLEYFRRNRKYKCRA